MIIWDDACEPSFFLYLVAVLIFHYSMHGNSGKIKLIPNGSEKKMNKSSPRGKIRIESELRMQRPCIKA